MSAAPPTKGGENERKAEEEYVKLRAALLQGAATTADVSAVSVAEVIDRLRDHSGANHAPVTVVNYTTYLVPFAKAHGRIRGQST